MGELLSQSWRGLHCPPRSRPFSSSSSWPEPSCEQLPPSCRPCHARCRSPPSSAALCLPHPTRPGQHKVQDACQLRDLDHDQLHDHLAGLVVGHNLLCCSRSDCSPSRSVLPSPPPRPLLGGSALWGVAVGRERTGRTSPRSSSPCNPSLAGKTSLEGHRRPRQRESC